MGSYSILYFTCVWRLIFFFVCTGDSPFVPSSDPLSSLFHPGLCFRKLAFLDDITWVPLLVMVGFDQFEFPTRCQRV